MDNGQFRKVFNQRLINFSLNIISMSSQLRLNKDLITMANQLIRSGTSVGANIFEAKACTTLKEYIRCFEMALKSANETTYWLILIGESKNCGREADRLMKECEEITKIISSSIITMKKKLP